MDWNQLLVAFMAFFAMMNPIAGLPVFLSLTGSDDARTSRTIARRALILAFGIITVFAVLGKLIFELFGLTLPALRIAGGIVVFLIGFHMVQGQHSSVQHPSESDKDDARTQALSVAISPLGMPLLAGPGTIAAAMNLSAQDGIMGPITTIVAFAALCLITYVLFRNGTLITRVLSQSAMNVITRLMGLILAVIGVQMVIAGVHGAFTTLR